MVTRPGSGMDSPALTHHEALAMNDRLVRECHWQRRKWLLYARARAAAAAAPPAFEPHPAAAEAGVACASVGGSIAGQVASGAATACAAVTVVPAGAESPGEGSGSFPLAALKLGDSTSTEHEEEDAETAMDVD